VRTLVLSERAERALVAAAATAALLAVSLWLTVPAAAVRALREERASELLRRTSIARAERRDVDARLGGMRDRARDAASLASRVAFLYGVSPADWPRALAPEAGVLSSSDPAALTDGLARYAAALDRAAEVLEARERADPSRARETPSRLPLAAELVEPSAVFGPRVSPWTGAEEFFDGLDLAAPAGTAVLAPSDGVVLFAGRVTPSPRSRMSRFGNLVVLGHGRAGATLYGHLGKAEVRRGQRVRRGERLGAVGRTGWAMAPTLHYEYWRPVASRGAERSARGADAALSPTDPRFAILDRNLLDGDVSLEKMLATSAPDPGEAPPGL
jgi:murein DD-endopeptidase MepM/ murein hydrolase activator NlpD